MYTPLLQEKVRNAPLPSEHQPTSVLASPSLGSDTNFVFRGKENGSCSTTVITVSAVSLLLIDPLTTVILIQCMSTDHQNEDNELSHIVRVSRI